MALPRCHRCETRQLTCHYEWISAADKLDIPETDVPAVQDTGGGGGGGEHLGFAVGGECIAPAAIEAISAGQLNIALYSTPNTSGLDLDWPSIMSNIEELATPGHLDQHYSTPENRPPSEQQLDERTFFAVKEIRKYPNLFVQACQTPFIHKALYQERMPCALQDTLAVCALYGQKNNDNESIVRRAVSQKAAQILGDESMNSATAVDQLARLQALILLRIIQLFDGDIRLRAEAEQTELLFINMIRQVQSRMHHLSGNEKPLSRIYSLDRRLDGGVSDVGACSWQKWVFAEALRRTILIGWTVGGLYSMLKNGSDSYHHEFNALSFYAQSALWDAQSEYRWLAALHKTSPLPVRLSDWDSDVEELGPTDVEGLGIMMMVLMKGIDVCAEWLGEERQSQFCLCA